MRGFQIMLVLMSLATLGCDAQEPAASEGDVASANQRLFDAVVKGDSAAVRQALDAGAEINSRKQDPGGFGSRWTPLHEAAMQGRIEVAEILIDGGADINAPEPGNGTPLHVSAANGHVEMTRLLIERGASLNGRGGTEQLTPLDMALRTNKPETVKLLRSRGGVATQSDAPIDVGLPEPSSNAAPAAGQLQ